ncbi:putative 3-deoxy-7-phosphoheptulonate synthase [Helianthus annuus]|nr:putative 3-deoxy-7-phosphoheptulonate synthase [Helianthus annuus]KAJ0596955.1 putative 3-deoxy-7-phosphoheptulonate synthase [Helianthus annuus]KAJ0757636.1 putative 3-deoxy-7-phosphoheptulonate synthase [Helianthus annuus]KAJ0761322.1 putative 3-deoxy-7-phosphoheptulonate synthase [Helianthus annuus]
MFFVSPHLCGGYMFNLLRNYVLQVSQQMDPSELVKLADIINPNNKLGSITMIVRMGAENMRVKLHL